MYEGGKRHNETLSIAPLHERLGFGEMREPEYCGVKLNLAHQTFEFNGKSIKISPQQYQVLWLLVRAQGRFLSRFDIEEFIRGPIGESRDIPLDESLINVLVYRLRPRLERNFGSNIQIVNERIYGYALKVNQP